MQKLRLIFLLFLSSVFLLSLKAQSSINTSAKVCLGDISNFSFTVPVGQTLSSITWDFGDGITSTVTTPAHTYGSLGKYTVKVQAVFASSSTGSDSFNLEVFGLPNAYFYYLPSSDTCFNDNIVCFMDTSSPAKTGQTIVSRLMVWGDGTYQNYSLPKKNDTICHQYPVSAKYTLRMEVTDNQGCVSSQGSFVNVVENITANFTLKDTFVNCQVAQIFMFNKSFGAGPATSHYRWYEDNVLIDTGFYFTNFKSINYSNTHSGKITLIAYANNNCRDTLTRKFTVVVDSLSDELILSDTVLCFSDQFAIECNYKEVAKDSLHWYRDGVSPFGIPPAPMPQVFTWFWNNYHYGLDTHEISIKIFRGSCIHTVKKKFVILGPAPGILPIDIDQCGSTRQVFLINKSIGVNPNNCTFFWSIEDSLGGQCTTWQKKNINLNMNCNYSKDFYIKHWFPKNPKPVYKAHLFIKDTVSGCADEAEASIGTDYCSPILIPDTFHLCVGEYFKMDEAPPFADSFSLDSGKHWLYFPSLIDSSYLNGIYDIGFKFKKVVSPWVENIGNDSIRIHKDSLTFYDTVFRKQRLWVHGGKTDSLYIKVYGKCRPFRVSVFFKNGWFDKNEGLRVNWSDQGNFDSTFTKAEHLDSIFHVYNITAMSHAIQIFMENVRGCKSMYRFYIERGKTIFINRPNFLNCIHDSVCYYPYIYDLVQHYYWPDNTSKNNVRWYFPSENKTIGNFKTCTRFSSGGMKAAMLIVNDSLGCVDTLIDTVFVQDVRANIKKDATTLYCNELKKFFDSSSYITNPKYHPFLPKYYKDSIKKYSWRFGDNVYNSFQKNPLQSINTSLDSIMASHAVETVNGCSDTVNFVIHVIGPKPYFLIRDTIGCGSLEAHFVNLSRNAKHYIWQFGDSLQTNLQVSNKNEVVFKYTKPGRYFISLIGIDTIYNPFTNKLQACVNTFPDKLFQRDTTRTVLVLPFEKTGIAGPDTICLNSPLFLSSLSDSAYVRDIWSFDDSAAIDTSAPSSIAHYYKKQGTYLIKLKPDYLDKIKNTCRDSAQKSIVVMGVKADFTIDPNNIAPVFTFHNTSQPGSAKLHWDFGQSGSSDNTSNDQNPSKNYGTDTGSYTVCLIASIDYGCKDTVCKIIFNDYLNDFGIPNVFTPGKLDGFNDKYDIEIEGETFYELKIYNRWGVLVYESNKDYINSEEGNWNGKVLNTGNDCAGATYYYIFRYKLKSKPNETKTIQGVIQLIR